MTVRAPYLLAMRIARYSYVDIVCQVCDLLMIMIWRTDICFHFDAKLPKNALFSVRSEMKNPHIFPCLNVNEYKRGTPVPTCLHHQSVPTERIREKISRLGRKGTSRY
jgi:hypothetical protein